MIETIIKMEKAGIAIAAAAVLLILVMTIYENLSEEFYKKRSEPGHRRNRRCRGCKRILQRPSGA